MDTLPFLRIYKLTGAWVDSVTQIHNHAHAHTYRRVGTPTSTLTHKDTLLCTPIHTAATAHPGGSKCTPPPANHRTHTRTHTRISHTRTNTHTHTHTHIPHPDANKAAFGLLE